AAGGPAHYMRVEWVDRSTFVFVAALEHEDLAAHDGGEFVGQVDEGLERDAGRQPDPDRRHRHEALPLNHGVGEVRGADHHGVDGLPTNGLQEEVEGAG